MFQAHFFVEVGQGSLGSFGVLRAPVHEETHTDAAEHGQNPDRVALAHPAAILVGAHVQALVQSGFDAPIITLPLQPLAGGQVFRRAAGQQILGVGLVAQALSQNDRTLGRSWKTGLLRVNDCRAQRADFLAAPILLRPRVRPLRRQRLWRGKKAAPVWAAVGPGSGAVLFGWP
jgi:hypothetical protein